MLVLHIFLLEKGKKLLRCFTPISAKRYSYSYVCNRCFRLIFFLFILYFYSVITVWDSFVPAFLVLFLLPSLILSFSLFLSLTTSLLLLNFIQWFENTCQLRIKGEHKRYASATSALTHNFVCVFFLCSLSQSNSWIKSNRVSFDVSSSEVYILY